MSNTEMEGEFEPAIALSVLNNLGCPVVITDAQRVDNPIVFANKAYLELSGYSLHEILGRNPRFMHGKHSSQPALEQFRRAIEAGEQCTVRVVNSRKDHSDYWCEVVLTPQYLPDGRHVGYWIGVQRDITAESSMEIWSALLAHDLKSPLLGVARLLGQIADGLLGSISEQQREALLSCREENYRALGTITDMLTLYRTLEALPSEGLQSFCVEDLLANVIQNLQSFLDPKSTISFRPSSIQSNVTTPKAALSHALNNIIDNALKYSRTRCVAVRTNRDRNDEFVKIDIQNDTALPLPENPFELPLEGIGAAFGWSTRLGLFLTKRMIELNGGTITYETIDDTAIFSVILPIDRAQL